MDMTISDVKVTLCKHKIVQAFVEVTIDHCFVIGDIRIVLLHGKYCVAMPSKPRKRTCVCGRSNELSSKFCSECRSPLHPEQLSRSEKKFDDIVHPITPGTRHLFEKAVFNAFLDALRHEHAATPLEEEDVDFNEEVFGGGLIESILA